MLMSFGFIATFEIPTEELKLMTGFSVVPRLVVIMMTPLAAWEP